MCLLLNAGFTVFWVFSYLGVTSLSLYSPYQNKDIFIYSTYAWYAIGVFWGYFLYYSMVFLVASACAYWYYQSDDNSVLRGLNNIKYHLGSICFGSIIITIISVLKVMRGNSSRQSGLTKCICICIDFCLS